MSEYEEWVKAVNAEDDKIKKAAEITRLDHYAAAALTGLLSDPTNESDRKVEIAFELAKLCLEERNKCSPENK